ncbi:MAG: PAS domain-containing protein [bacterium]|nr:PAS domain-containing protein [bacterium]
MTERRRKGVAQRREVQILLPAALLLLVLLSTYTLFSYRSAIALLVEERQNEAAELARQLSGELVSPRSLPGTEDLRRRLPQAIHVAVLDADGGLLAGSTAVAAAEESLVAGSARFKKGEETLTLRVELPAALLRSRQRGVRVLTPVLLTVNGAITLLVLIFLRRFLAPFDRLVERARSAGQVVPEEQDEVVFLVETFEKALEALARPAPAGGEIDELKALESTLTRSLESGVLLLDAQGIVLALNEIGTSLLHITPPAEEPVARALGRHPELAALLERAIRRERPVQRVECAIESPVGERTLGVTAHPLRRDDGALRGFLVIFADLTEVQKEREERQLADSLSQLGELTAGVAHELRNSLATLRGYLALIDRGGDQESIADYLGEIRRESDHLERVLDDFLMFARPGSARPREVDLLGLVHRAAADPALGEARVTVSAEGGEGAVPFLVRGDPQLLERALRNVLSNAAFAQTAAGSEEPVRVRLAGSETEIEISIEDRGEGLSEQAREKLFDPFFTQRAGGIGLGLALTRRIVLLHSGRIALDNRASGGARATLWIPRGKTVTESNGGAWGQGAPEPG